MLNSKIIFLSRLIFILIGYILLNITIQNSITNYIPYLNNIFIYLNNLNKYELFLYYFILFYFPTSYLIDTRHKYLGGSWESFRRLKIMTPFLNWLLGPCKLHNYLNKNELNKIKKDQVIWCIFPHGVGSWSHYLLMTNNVHFMDIFPRKRLDLAADILFQIPLFRELVLWAGNIDATRRRAERILKHGYSTSIYIGGEREQVLTKYKRHQLYLSKRFGFVKLAIKYNIPLIPLYCWGENDLYYTSSFLYNLRVKIVKFFHIAIPLAFGRWWCPLLPMPKGLNLVIGKPIYPPKRDKNKDITREEIADLHAKFIDGLKDLFETSRKDFGSENDILEII